jgi:nucleotide-binding universal stress UspA family protein
MLPAAVRGNWRLVIGRPPVPARVDLAPAYAMLVCGTHGRTGVSRVLMGSVAERLVRAAPGPVLILRP